MATTLPDHDVAENRESMRAFHLGHVQTVVEALTELGLEANLTGLFVTPDGRDQNERELFSNMREQLKSIDPKESFTTNMQSEFLRVVSEVGSQAQTPAMQVAELMKQWKALYTGNFQVSGEQAAKYTGRLLALHSLGFVTEDFCKSASLYGETQEAVLNSLCADNMYLGLETRLVMLKQGIETPIEIENLASLTELDKNEIDADLVAQAQELQSSRTEIKTIELPTPEDQLKYLDEILNKFLDPQYDNMLSEEDIRDVCGIIYRTINVRRTSDVLILPEENDEIVNTLIGNPADQAKNLRAILKHKLPAHQVLNDLQEYIGDVTSSSKAVEANDEFNARREHDNELRKSYATVELLYAAYYSRHFERSLPKMSPTAYRNYLQGMNDKVLEQRKRNADLISLEENPKIENMMSPAQAYGLLMAGIDYGWRHGYLQKPQ